MKTISSFNKILLTLAILLTVSFAQNIQAKTDDPETLFGNEEKGQFHHRRGERIKAFLAEQLGLSDAQKAQIKEIRQNHKENIKPLVEELRAKQKELRQSFEADNYNETLAAQKISEMSGVKARLIGERLKLKKDLLAVLTPEQKTKLEQLKDQFKSRRIERMKRHHNNL
ncbi:MAG: Spy/CpxP family protein refolding chaperone [Acidobacteria bacterium]|nr:Spy/CpxP family protein refolding chaperone [Acidobacteriota bacterium]